MAAYSNLGISRPRAGGLSPRKSPEKKASPRKSPEKASRKSPEKKASPRKSREKKAAPRRKSREKKAAPRRASPSRIAPGGIGRAAEDDAIALLARNARASSDIFVGMTQLLDNLKRTYEGLRELLEKAPASAGDPFRDSLSAVRDQSEKASADFLSILQQAYAIHGTALEAGRWIPSSQELLTAVHNAYLVVLQEFVDTLDSTVSLLGASANNRQKKAVDDLVHMLKSLVDLLSLQPTDSIDAAIAKKIDTYRKKF